ncbi:hypothetical protein [Bosea robiniae]|uniref:hypothetical protein n=1 Tax=Bosea robiniae TaxID=1036780 RepID=UPI001114575B|nr:hypothetical protein [Bosea robiniae]
MTHSGHFRVSKSRPASSFMNRLKPPTGLAEISASTARSSSAAEAVLPALRRFISSVASAYPSMAYLSLSLAIGAPFPFLEMALNDLADYECL